MARVLQEGPGTEVASVRHDGGGCGALVEFVPGDVQEDPRDGSYVVCPACKQIPWIRADLLLWRVFLLELPYLPVRATLSTAPSPRVAAEDALRRLNPYTQRGVEAFDRVVRVVTRDGTEFFFHDATGVLWNNPVDRNRRWLLAWTEHYGYHAFSLEDLKYYGIFVQTEFEKLDESDPDTEAGR